MYPMCHNCGMHVSSVTVSRQQTKYCGEEYVWKMRHEAAANSRLTLEQKFTAYIEKLKRVKVIKYLGWLLSYNDNDTQAMRGNPGKKARH